MIVMDIWSGPCSLDHVARRMLAGDVADHAAEIAFELAAGNLVNLRNEIAWSPESEFDDRQEQTRAPSDA